MSFAVSNKSLHKLICHAKPKSTAASANALYGLQNEGLKVVVSSLFEVYVTLLRC